MSTIVGGRLEDETAAVWCKRYTEALDAGLDDRDADRFASSSRDIGELRALVVGGCPIELMARILRE